MTLMVGIGGGWVLFSKGTEFGSERCWATFPWVPLPAHLGHVPWVLFLFKFHHLPLSSPITIVEINAS